MTEESERTAGRLSGLHYALAIVQGRRAVKRTAHYLAALNDVELFLEAAIERVENGEPMWSTATTQQKANGKE